MFCLGKPIKIKKNISTNEDLKLSKILENNLLKLTKKADRYCN